jgi:23S rRNA (uracil1939-C5)-methyltransferase
MEDHHSRVKKKTGSKRPKKDVSMQNSASKDGKKTTSTTMTAPVAIGESHTVEIEKLTFGGAGLTHVNGMVVFVPGSIPGQKLEVAITKITGNSAEAQVEKVLKKAKDEVMPRCTHFHDCGGCTWQNLSYDKQIGYKEEIVRETLEHLTPVDDTVRKSLPGRVLKIIPSPQVFHYRNKLELSFGYENSRAEERNGKRIYFDENPSIGFHQPGQWATILPITECHLYDEQLASLLSDVRRFLQETNLPVYNPKTKKGLLRSLLLRRGIHTGEQMICFAVNARKRELEPLFQHFMRFGGRPNLASLQIVEYIGGADRPDGSKTHCLAGKPHITERLFDLSFEISPYSFFQTNTHATEKLYQSILDTSDIGMRDTILDAYCGMGTIGQYLSRFCEKVVGIESHPTAIEDALKSSAHNRIANISFYKGRTEHVLNNQIKPEGKYNFDIIIVDPPRAGLHPRARTAMMAHGPRQIVYISCNTSTFARDLGDFLKHGYELRTVQPVDMFPHTGHIETVAVLQKKDD